MSETSPDLKLFDGPISTTWHKRFLELARTVAGWSKDPSSQVGAVIVRPDKTVVSLGFNVLPRRIGDTAENLENRERKLSMILHAEVNALITAKGETQGMFLYTWPFPPCTNCAAQIIQAGISEVVILDQPLPERWQENFILAQDMFREAGVNLRKL